MTGPNLPRSVYLAGPDVFLPDALAVIAAKQTACEAFGFVYHPPIDNRAGVRPDETPVEISRRIYAANLALIRASDFGIFNLTPFRGPSADVGTCVELGVMTGLGKPAFAYSNVAGAYIDRIAPRQSDKPHHWIDAEGRMVEDFGNADNLMCDGAVAAWGFAIQRHDARLTERFQDLAAFQRCLENARDYYDAIGG